MKMNTLRRGVERGTDRQPLDQLSPARVAIWGIATWVVMFIVAPVRIVTEQSVAPYLYITLGFFAFFAGCLLARETGRNTVAGSRESEPLSDAQLNRVHTLTAAVAAAGAVAKVIDVFLVRHVSLAGTVVERRGDMNSVGANPVSIIAAVLMPACLIVPLTWQLLRQRGISTRGQAYLTHILFAVPVLSAAAVAGARSAILIYLLVYALYAYQLGRLRVRVKTVFLSGLACIVVLAISTAIFNNRLEAMHMNPLDSVFTSGYAFTVQPQQWITDVMQNSVGMVGDLAFAFLSTCQYYVHGVFEFVYQYQNQPDHHLWGAASFNAYYKFAAIATGLPSPEDLWMGVAVHPGIYITFFGPVYIDFGWAGAIYMLGIGVLAQRIWQNAREGSVGAVPFYMYLVYVIFLFPVSNGIFSNQGLYTLTDFGLFFWILSRVQPSASKSQSTARARRRLALYGPDTSQPN